MIPAAIEEQNRAGRIFTEIIGPCYLFQFVANGVEFFLMGENHYKFSKIDVCDVYKVDNNEIVLVKGTNEHQVTVTRFLYAWFLRTKRKTDFFLESI